MTTGTPKTGSNYYQRIAKWMPGLAAIRTYNPGWLQADVLAGLSVAAVALPIAIAYSQIAGVPPVNGLYASILPLIAYALFGSSRQLIMAPDAATCTLVAATLIPLAAGDAIRYISLSMALSILAGITCIIAGIARLGFLTNFLSQPILTGYLNGIALSIIVGQLGKLFGFSLQANGFFRLLFEFFTKLGQTHGLTLAVGLSIFVLLRLLKQIAPKLPAPLLAVVLGIAVVVLFGLDRGGVAVVGPIPAGIPPLKIPVLQATDLAPLMIGAVGIALVSFNSAMVTAESFAVKNHYELDSNQELIALGMADIAAGISQGFAVSGADSRTAVNDSAGGKTQLTGIAAAIFMTLVLLFLTVPLAYLPIAVLAAVLINSALGLFDLRSLQRLYQISIPEFRLSLLTTLGVITIGVLKGVLVAIGLAIIQLVYRASRPHDAILGQIEGTDGFHDIEGQAGVQTILGLIIYRFDAPLLFFNANFFKARVRMVSDRAEAGTAWFLLDAEAISGIDTTAATKLEEVRGELARKGIVLAIARAKGPLRKMLERTGLTEQIGRERFFPTISSAVAAFHCR